MMEIEALPVSRTVPEPDALVTVTLTIPRSQVDKLHAFMGGDTWEKAQAARDARLSECVKSAAALLNMARRHRGTSGGRACAAVLASLYNGFRVKVDLSDLKCLDAELFEHALNTMRACYELHMEPHQFFEDGGRLLEELIADWGLEKKPRRRR